MLPSAFDVLGPIMVGPSSSHTAGALRIGRMAAELAPSEIQAASFSLYNSFARTAEGHGTAKALVAGILGMDTDDPRIRSALEIAGERGIDIAFTLVDSAPEVHPNTADITLYCEGGSTVEVRGESIGGGRIRLSAIDGAPIEVTGDLPTLFIRHHDEPGVLGRLCTAVAVAGVNIATIKTTRKAPGGDAFTVIESDEVIPVELLEALMEDPEVVYGRVLFVAGARLEAQGSFEEDFTSASSLLALFEALPGSIGAVMRRREIALVAQDRLANAEASVDASMARVLAVMGDEVRDTLEDPRPSLGGFLNGEAQRVFSHRRALELLGGDVEGRAMAYAMATIERSDTMGVIVAAPTAGASGIVPGSLIALGEALAEVAGLPRSPAASLPRVEKALWCAAAIGAIAQGNASVSGAEAGCQAETGVAAAMAAAALTQMLYGSPAACLSAAAIAIANTLGLVCDPALGLVEYPCQLRNAGGVAQAFCAARLALSGVESPVGLDEALSAMDHVGAALPASLRETAGGGLAQCPSILARCKRCPRS